MFQQRGGFSKKACELLEKLENEEFELMAVARKIWLCRNTFVFGGDLTHPAQLVRSTKVNISIL